jgi:hypothetical protein
MHISLHQRALFDKIFRYNLFVGEGRIFKDAPHFLFQNSIQNISSVCAHFSEKKNTCVQVVLVASLKHPCLPYSLLCITMSRTYTIQNIW